MSRSTSIKSIFDTEDEERQSLKGDTDRRDPQPKWNRQSEYARQNKDIDELSLHVSAVSQMTNMIYEQVVESQSDLEKLESGMDTSKGRLEHITARTQNLVNKAGGPRYCCIIMCLSLVAFILLLLLIYT